MALLGLSSSYYAFQKRSIYSSVESVRQLGFELCELGAAHDFEKDALDTVKKVKNDFPEMKFTVHGLFPPLKEKFWFNPSEGLTSQNKKVVEGLFAAAEIAEAEMVSIHPGFLNKVSFSTGKKGMSFPKKQGLIPRQKAMQNLFIVLEECVKKAEDIGTNFSIENLCKSTVLPLVGSVEDFREVFTEFPSVGLLLDLGHALFEDNLVELLSLHQQVRQMHLHFSEKEGADKKIDQHAPIPNDFPLKTLSKIDYLNRIPLVLEHGLDVSAEEIIREKILIEKFIRSHSNV